MATIKLSPNQRVVLSALRTENSRPGAGLIGTPEWSTNAPAIVSLNPAPDGITCEVKSKGPLGIATVDVDAEGTVALNDSIDIEVVAATAFLADAVTIAVNGAPKDI